MWCRVFGTNDSEPAPAALLEHLHGLGLPVTAKFTGDDQGWFRAELVVGGGAAILPLERFLVSEDDIRSELNNWAAWIETTGEGPPQVRLMQHMISTRQLYTIRRPGGQDISGKICVGACRFLARQTDGVYQVDEQGFFDAEGTLLLPE